MKSPFIKASFLMAADAAQWAGQALYSQFPDGLLVKDGPKSSRLSGWARGIKPDQLEALRDALARLGAGSIRFQNFRPRDWAREYRSRFPAQRLGRFHILPSWRRRSPLPKGAHPIVLLPGQAFGTGLHPSTRLMLAGVARHAPMFARVLDVGAGSGILGFACLRLGTKKVTSIEIEEAACEEMRGNRKLNGVTPGRMRVIHGTFPLKGGRLRAELVLANLVTPVLLKLMRQLKAAVLPGGILLMSGIHTKAEADRVAKAAAKTGLKLRSRQSKGDWWCLSTSR